MSEQIDGDKIRRVLLEVVAEFSQRGPGYLQSGAVLQAVDSKLGSPGEIEFEQALLESWYGLFRTGHLCWGYNIGNLAPPQCHVTQQGRKTLENLSRDPANPEGYLAHLAKVGSLNPIAESYVHEALRTYNANCFKAAAVMIGVAAESVVLQIRDRLVEAIENAGEPPTAKLKDWKIKVVLDAIEVELADRKKDMPRGLADSFEAYWPAFTQQIRAARNDAGHPASIEPVTPEAVHASLLIFPELVELASRLSSWIPQGYASDAGKAD